MSKPLPDDEFAKKYKKEGTLFLLVKASKPVQDPDTKRTHFIPVNIQLAIQQDGSVSARQVS